MIKRLFSSKLFKLFFYSFLLFLLFGCICFYVIENSTKKQLTENAADLPHCKAGLVLGTSRYLRNGNHNLYFTFRIDAAVKLFMDKKVNYLLLSGDNRKEIGRAHV